MKTKFYRCNVCGNIILKIVDSDVQPSCCGKEMEELIPKTKEEGMEFHLPVINRVDNSVVRVEIGSKPHPMTPQHCIQWIYLETKRGGQFIKLTPDCKPTVEFCTCIDEPIAIYEYCNVHGLWKTILQDPLKNSELCSQRKQC